jgi:hypothetical protein
MKAAMNLRELGDEAALLGTPITTLALVLVRNLEMALALNDDHLP